MPDIEVIARGLWTHQGRALLCRNVQSGYYYLPGGHVEPGEAARTALARELHEELALDLADGSVGECLLVAEVLFTQNGRARHEVNLVFRLAGPPLDDPKSTETDIAFDWLEQAAIVDYDIRPACIKAWLAADTSTVGLDHPAWLSSAE